MMNPFAHTVLCGVVFAAAWIAPISAQQPSSPDTAAYLLVIDHSGSMTARLPSGKSRWAEMQEKAIELVRNIPLESRVWITVFSNKIQGPYLPAFKTENDRQAVIDRIQRAYGSPQGGTALYDTLGLAFEEAERLANANPGRHISVLAYTDGRDQGSRKWTPRKLQQRFKQLVGNNRNLWLFYTRIEGGGIALNNILKDSHATEGTFKNPLPMTLARNAFGLKNPVQNPEQTIDLEFAAPDAQWLSLRNTQLRFAFEPDQGQAISVAADPVEFRKGPIPVRLKVANADQLQANRAYSGALKIIYPTLSKHEVKAGDNVRLTFQKTLKVEIYDRRPKDNAIFAAGKPVHFWVNTLQGAKVLWDFGDGSSATGAETQHVYNTAGKRTVTVSVEADPRVGPTRQTFAIEILDIGVNVDPIAGIAVEGAPLTLTAAGRGAIERYQWVIDGQSFAGAARKDGAKGSQISYTFNQPGRHLVSIIGYAEKAVVQSEERSIQLIERPDLQIVHPQSGQAVQFGRSTVFQAHLKGPVEEVAWIIRRKDDAQNIVRRITRPVVRQEKSRVSELSHSFAETADEEELDLVVEAIGALPKDLPIAAPTKQVAFRVTYPKLVAKVLTTGASPFRFGKKIQFQLDCSEELKRVTWDFGDDTKDESNNPSPIHQFGATGRFVVRATVEGRGGRTTSAEHSVNIIAEAPTASPKLLVGGEEVDRATLGDTAELKNESTGDVVNSVWYYDDKEIPPGQLSLPLNDLGEHRLRLRVVGPPNLAGVAPTDEKELLFHVWKAPNHLAFWLPALAVIALAGFFGRLVLGNEPRVWRLYYSPHRTPNEDNDPSLRVRDYWSLLTKKAEVPMKKLFGECDYWGAGGGAEETLVIHARKDGPFPGGAIGYSGEGNDRVRQLYSDEDGKRTDYRWQDSRCPDEQYRTFHLRLVKHSSSPGAPLAVLALILLVLAGGLWWLWSLVY